VLAVVVYFSLRIDWAKVIGRWFPWALKNSDEEEEEDLNDNNKDNNHNTKKEP
jgi:hypothetical protein